MLGLEEKDPVKTELEQHIETDEHRRGMQSGANWFFWIAGGSLINSLVVFFGGEWGLLIGLGITQIIDALSISLQGSETGAASFVRFGLFGLNLAAAGFFALIGWLARQGKGWAFLLGLLVYFADGLIFLIVFDLLSIGFHIFALVCIFLGYRALGRLNAIEPNPVTNE